jgi:hypothetical protein
LKDPSEYRSGSPFAVDPAASAGGPKAGLANPVAAAPATDFGPLNAEPEGAAVWGAAVWGAGAGGTTASAALVSAIFLLPCATLAWHFFPAGGITVAVLGIAMSALGLSSRRAKLAVVALGLHAWLFIACTLRAI